MADKLVRCVYGACVRSTPSVRDCNSHCTFSAQRTVTVETRPAEVDDVVRICQLHPEGLAPARLLELCRVHGFSDADRVVRVTLERGLLRFNSEMALVSLMLA